MFRYKARFLLNLSRDAQRRATVSFIESLSVASTPVTERLLLDSAATQARSLEGRPLAMDSSLMLPDRSRLRLLESWPGSPPQSANRGDRCSASGGQAGIARREAEADARAFGEGGRVMDLGMFVPWALATKGLVGGSSKQWPTVSNGVFSDSPNLTAAVLGVFVVGTLVLCGGHAYCRQFMGSR
jgi:hypothetical protein